MNGHNAAAPVLPARMPNVDLVATLEWLLAQAKSGEVVSLVAAYSYGGGHVEIKINAPQPMEMYVGCEILRQTLFSHMMKPKPSPTSRIMKPYGGN